MLNAVHVTANPLVAVAAEDVLGMSRPRQMVSAAITALEQGLDSPSLRVLAGLSPADLDEAGSWFRRSLLELGIEPPSPPHAVMIVARGAARALLAGDLAPDRAARWIWDATIAADCTPGSLHSFVYAASEWESRPEDRERFVEGIRRAAEDLLEA